ncbi:alginate lyase family protein [Mucilaginibacter terrae]|uniref:alginate lyase family protein n=1 Tax=Mucilaginibacter terrae TaxID=1955052 RepID=UPI00363014C7
MKSLLKLSTLLCITVAMLTACKKPEVISEAVETAAADETPYRSATIFSGDWQHPGILNSQQDLDRMRSKVNANLQPWKGSYDKLAADFYAQSTYTIRGPQGVTVVNRETGGLDPTGSNTRCDKDSRAAYENALMWYITQDVAYANKSRDLIDAWASVITDFTGADSRISASLYGYNFINAAEILKHTGYSGWTSGYNTRATSFFTGPVYNEIKNYNQIGPGNQDAFIIKCMMAIGVFTENTAIFQRAVDEFYGRSTPANGNLANYILPSGQCQETNRDQNHTQVGLGSLAEACEIGKHQYMDMYGALDNRLLRGYEFTARYNSGNGFASTPVDYDGITGSKDYGDVPSTIGYGTFFPVYALAYYHYGYRKGLLSSSSMTYLKQVAESISPEGTSNDPAAPGFGTLLFAVGPYGGNALTNYSFEGGTVNWYAAGGAILTSNTTLHIEGSKSISVESRDFDYSGPRQDVKQYLLDNGQGLYDLSAYIRTISTTSTIFTGQVNIKLVDGTGTHYYTAKEKYDDSFAQISGSANVTWSGTLTAAEFYVTTPGNSYSIAVDKCSLVKVK